MVARLRRHRLPRIERDVRRVAGQHVDGAGQVVEGGRHVAVAQVDAGARPGCASAQACAASSSSTACTTRRRDLVGDRLGDRSGPGAQVDDHRPGRASRSSAHCSIAQPASSSVSGRGTKTPGPDRELDVAEVRRAGQVLQRLPRRAAGEQRVVLLERRRGRRRRPAPAASGSCRARGRAARRRRARGWRRPRLAAGRSPPRARSRRRAHCSSASSRAARSASMQESRTGCRSPSSTWSRL